jgi:hypothetical protein
MIEPSRTVDTTHRVARGGLRGQLMDRRSQAALAFGLVVLWATIFGLTTQVGYDSITYLAAGERLNAGHALYHLAAGDRPVDVAPPYWLVPIVYPPLIGVLWRPLAALPAMLGFWAFVATSGGAMLWATFHVLRGLRAETIALVAVLSFAIGLEVIIGNVAGFLVAGYVATWVFRDRPWIGAVVGVMTALKITPGTLLIWLIGQRRWRAVVWGLGSLAVCLAVGVVGAGWDAHVEYLDVARSLVPQPLSLAGLTGVGSATLIAEVVGALAVLALRGRPAWSYRVAILTMLLGSPAVGFQAPAVLVAMGAPREGE